MVVRTRAIRLIGSLIGNRDDLWAMAFDAWSRILQMSSNDPERVDALTELQNSLERRPAARDSVVLSLALLYARTGAGGHTA